LQTAPLALEKKIIWLRTIIKGSAAAVSHRLQISRGECSLFFVTAIFSLHDDARNLLKAFPRPRSLKLWLLPLATSFFGTLLGLLNFSDRQLLVFAFWLKQPLGLTKCKFPLAEYFYAPT